MGFIIMEPEDTPAMSGPNSICVATALLHASILPMQEPETRLTLEAPGGLNRDYGGATTERPSASASRMCLRSRIGSMRHLRLRAWARSRSTLLMAR